MLLKHNEQEKALLNAKETSDELEKSIADIVNEFLNTPSDGCKVNKWLLTLPEKDAEAINMFKTMKSEKIANLYRALASSKQGVPFKASSFRSHLKGLCKCQ